MGHFAGIALIGGICGGIFIVLLPKFVHITFLDYMFNTIGMVLIGFSIVYLLPKVERAFELIRYYNQDDLLAEKELNNYNGKEGSYSSGIMA